MLLKARAEQHAVLADRTARLSLHRPTSADDDATNDDDDDDRAAGAGAGVAGKENAAAFTDADVAGGGGDGPAGNNASCGASPERPHEDDDAPAVLNELLSGVGSSVATPAMSPQAARVLGALRAAARNAAAAEGDENGADATGRGGCGRAGSESGSSVAAFEAAFSEAHERERVAAEGAARRLQLCSADFDLVRGLVRGRADGHLSRGRRQRVSSSARARDLTSRAASSLRSLPLSFSLARTPAGDAGKPSGRVCGARARVRMWDTLSPPRATRSSERPPCRTMPATTRRHRRARPMARTTPTMRTPSS